MGLASGRQERLHLPFVAGVVEQQQHLDEVEQRPPLEILAELRARAGDPAGVRVEAG
jgi:hypothetical protein